MKKQTLYIIITLVVAVILGGLLLLLYFTDPARTVETDAASTEEEGGVLISHDAAGLVSIKVTNPSSEFTIIRDSAAEAEDDTGTLHYTIEGYEDFGVKSGTLSAAALCFTELSYTKEIGEVADVTVYGLDGSSRAVATFEDGSTEELVFGITPGESSGRYVLYNGKVYICAVNALYMTSLENQLGNLTWTIDPYSDDEGNYYNYLNSFLISGTNFEREIEINFDPDTYDYVMAKPVSAVASIDLMESMATSLAYFETYSVAAVDPDEAKLAELGLVEPYVDMHFMLNGNAHRITLGNQAGAGYRYGYVDGDKSTVYTISETYYSAWADVTETMLRDGYVYLKMIYDIDKITVKTQEKTAVIDISREVNEDLSTDSSISYDYFAKLDGKDVEYSGNVNSFYAEIIGIPFVSMTELEVTGEPVVSITYSEYDSDEDVVIEFYRAKDQENRIVALINGEYSATVRDTSIQDFLTAFDSFLANNE